MNQQQVNQQQERSEFVRENGYGRFWDSQDCQKSQPENCQKSQPTTSDASKQMLYNYGQALNAIENCQKSQPEKLNSQGLNQSQAAEPTKFGEAQSYSVGYNDGLTDAMTLVRHSETRANQLINSLYHQVAQLEKTVKHAVAMIKYGVSEHHPMVLDLEFEGACRQFLSQHGGA